MRTHDLLYAVTTVASFLFGCKRDKWPIEYRHLGSTMSTLVSRYSWLDRLREQERMCRAMIRSGVPKSV